MTKGVRRKNNPPPILSRLNYDLLYDMMHTIARYTGDLFMNKKLSISMKVNGAVLSRQSSYLLNSGALSVYWEVGTGTRRQGVKVYQRHFCEKNIDSFLDIMLLNHMDGRQND